MSMRASYTVENVLYYSIPPVSNHSLNKAFKLLRYLPPFSLLRDFCFQNTFEHFAIRFRQSYLIWEVSDVTAIESSS